MSAGSSQPELFKLVVFVPPRHADAVRTALGAAGAGHIGEYDFCSFSCRGVGRFRPLTGTRPYAGEVGELETVEEERIETLCTRDTVRAAIEAVRTAHPYEEPAMDVYPVCPIDGFVKGG